jgi:hypothetical protein
MRVSNATPDVIGKWQGVLGSRVTMGGNAVNESGMVYSFVVAYCRYDCMVAFPVEMGVEYARAPYTCRRS